MPEPASADLSDCSCDPPAPQAAGDPPPPLACDLSAIPAAERATHAARAAHLLATAQATQELPDGYAFRYPAAAYPQVVAFIANERRCCPFFTFVLAVPAGAAPLELRITGAAGVKVFLRAVLGVVAALPRARP
ncbi:MAG TPA: hypothetical protein VKY74_25675 [Chloroflexia bacterium]|nr:hypothetical protein [Chloroflexia bacterium]